MNYEQAIEYLKGLTKFGINLGLDRIEELLRRLGEPHRRLKVIHVGGTNGKGSTTAMITSILEAAGYKVGRFTSPHLHSYNERFVINGKPISEFKLAELITIIKPFLEEMVSNGYEHPTEFEVSTAIALLYFEREATNYVVLEVGMGGIIDSTNVVNPMVSVITNVSLDHMDYLGNSIEEITKVKAGIIKPGVPIITAAEGVSLKIIKQVAEENNSSLVQVGQHVTWSHGKNYYYGGQEFNIYGLNNHYYIYLPLLGEHQQINAATAIVTVETLLSNSKVPSSLIIENGLRNVRWPGRLEILGKNPTVIIDGAHNHGGATALRKALRKYFPGHGIVMVLGMLADKERKEVVKELVPLSRAVIVTRSNNPRAGEWTEVAKYARIYVEDVTVMENVGYAVGLALKKAHPDEVVCITGSLYMIAKAREFLLNGAVIR